MTGLAAYARASERLLGLIREGGSDAVSPLSRLQRAEARLARTRELLSALGDPQRRFPAVHVTGTSGKGSVAAMIAAILTAGGYRVGLRTSPYIQVATEKLQIGSLLIDPVSLDRFSERVIATHLRREPKEDPINRLAYAEAWSALTMLWLAEEHVDIAVIEVGAGGRFDATNVFDPVVSVITSVGLDHVGSLGPTIADIAWHKAGIIKPGSTAVVGSVPLEAWAVIRREAEATGARLVQPTPRPSISAPLTGMPGAFQQANAEVAISAIDALRGHGFPVSDAAIASGLAATRLPGRLERMPGTKPPVVWIDGAHNIDKIAALAHESKRFSTGGSPPIVVLGILKTKDAAAIAAGVAPLASAIVATEPTVLGRSSLPAWELAAAMRSAGFSGEVHTEPDPNRAMLEAERLARAQGSNVLVTGSMYLAGQVRRRWYPDADIIVQRTPWPASRTEEPGYALPERSVAL